MHTGIFRSPASMFKFFFFLNYFIYLNKEGMVANSLKHKLSEATCGLLDAL